MKLVNRQAVEGTHPTIYIGHRTYRDRRTAKIKVTRTWYAEYCRDVRSVYQALSTTNKTQAIRAAHKIIDRLDAGQTKNPSRRRDIQVVVNAYLEMQTKRHRAPKTLEKYTYVLNDLARWVQSHGARQAAAFSESDFWDFHSEMTKRGLAEKNAPRSCDHHQANV